MFAFCGGGLAVIQKVGDKYEVVAKVETHEVGTNGDTQPEERSALPGRSHAGREDSSRSSSVCREVRSSGSLTTGTDGNQLSTCTAVRVARVRQWTRISHGPQPFQPPTGLTSCTLSH